MNNRKGIILSGGSGTRLYPITSAMSKQLLPVYDKPMIYYPLYTLMLSGIRQILIISNIEYMDLYKNLLQDGSQIGIEISYKIQPKPEGLAQSFILGEEFLDNNPSALILGDNIFQGMSFQNYLSSANSDIENSTIFAYKVNNPQAFGVVGFDRFNNVISIEEKPQSPQSDYAVTGLYFYDKDVCKKAKTLKPSKRNELEITDLNNIYIKEGKLKTILLPNDFNWYDTGTFNSLLDASNFIKNLQDKNHFLYACLELIAFKNGWIDKKQLKKQLSLFGNNHYKNFLTKVLNNPHLIKD